MELQIKKITPTKLKIDVQIPWTDFSKFYQKSIKELGKDLEIPGFRKGQVPDEMIEKSFDPSEIQFKAANLCLEEVWPKIVIEKNIEAISQPKIEIKKLAKDNPFEFSAEVEILPEINLPDYKAIAKSIEKKEVKVEEKEVDDTINWLYNSRKDSQKNLTINDQWAQTLGNFKNLEELRTNIRQGIVFEKESAEVKRQREEFLEKMVEKTEIEVPEIMIEREKSQILENLKRNIDEQLKIPFEEYLKNIKKTPEELEKELIRLAEKQLKKDLIVYEIEKKENISVNNEEVEARVNEVLKVYPDIETAKKEVDLDNLKLYIEDEIKKEKVFNLLFNN